MTGIVIVLFLTGCIFMVGSFFVAEKLSPSELSKIGELTEEELRRVIDSEIRNADSRIEEAIEDAICASGEKVDRALEKETNTKIMAISEYSETVLEHINKAHNEIMFLYDMLNDKHTQLTGMTSDLQRLAADIRNLEEIRPPQKALEKPAAKPQLSAEVLQPQPPVAKRMPDEMQKKPEETVQKPLQQKTTSSAKISGYTDNRARILALHKQGRSEVDIARALKMGIGEVRLVIGLYKGE
ncbi:MAG: DUF6115 domain-containing protein [Roseburia sp.]